MLLVLKNIGILGLFIIGNIDFLYIIKIMGDKFFCILIMIL